ncbi:MAG: 2-polyprenylphenol 6-hydroxylase [Gammaproteobacteria bacterium]
MKKLYTFFRLLRIQWILIRYGLDDIIASIPWLWPFRIFAYLNPWNWFVNRRIARAKRVRLALESLGPLFIKFGQVLSTRYDILPEDILAELSNLQDNVSPFVLPKKSLDKLQEQFKTFSQTPIASASIAQVHEAILETGEEVVVKIMRPGVKKRIQQDLVLLKLLAKLIEQYWPDGHRFKPTAMVAEIEATLNHETDFMQEAANASQLKRNLKNDKNIVIPDIYWDESNATTLVMERVQGIPISDTKAIEAAGIDRHQLALLCLKTFFTQVFRDRFFHGDWHPGNLFIQADDPMQPKLVLVDFGLTGTLTDWDRRYIAENILAFTNKDYAKVAELHIQSGWVPGNIRADQFEATIRTVCEPIMDKTIKDVSFGQILIRLLHTAREFDINIQPQLIVLQKNLLHVEGLCRKLDPDLNLWNAMHPIVREWLKQEVGPKAFLKKVKDNFPQWLEVTPELPVHLHRFLEKNMMHFQEKQTPQKKHKRSAFTNITILLFIILLIGLNNNRFPIWANEALIVAGLGFLLLS